MKRLYLGSAFLSLFALLAGCQNDGRSIRSFLTLDVKKAIDNKQTFALDEITDEIEFVTLDDTGKESLLRDPFYSILESENGFYILDYPIEPVKLFDKTGKFKSSRGMTGRGPNEYMHFIKRAIDYERDNLYLGDNTSILAYDTNGQIFAHADSLPDGLIAYHKNRLLLFRDPIFPFPDIGDSTIFIDIYLSDLRHESSVSEIFNGNSRAIAGSIETGLSRKSIGRFISHNGSRLVVKRGRNDTVYLFTSNMSLEPAYKLEMGGYSPPAEMFEGIKSLEEWEKYYSVEKMFEGERYIVAEVENGAFGVRSFLVFDKSDPLSGFTTMSPDGQSGMFIDGIEFTPSYIRDNRLVGYMRALDIVDKAEAITNPDLKALAATLREDSNPVIVIAKLKK